MATTSFGQKFYVSSKNIDAFVETVTASPAKGSVVGFKSRSVSKDELQKFVDKSRKK